jgi:hypothetical protein
MLTPIAKITEAHWCSETVGRNSSPREEDRICMIRLLGIASKVTRLGTLCRSKVSSQAYFCDFRPYAKVTPNQYAVWDVDGLHIAAQDQAINLNAYNTEFQFNSMDQQMFRK